LAELLAFLSDSAVLAAPLSKNSAVLAAARSQNSVVLASPLSHSVKSKNIKNGRWIALMGLEAAVKRKN